MFDDELYKVVKSADGSSTAYSKEYDECYHSTKDGALNESLTKHIKPAFLLKGDLECINILDICFGLGFNTLSTLYYHKKNNLNSKVYIYSPELDAKLVKSLKNFTYPKEFEGFLHILESLDKQGFYEDKYFYIELFLGDGREYVKKFKNHFDIVYQDAFSPSTNPVLWTKEYFSDIKTSMKDDGVLTTYSTALRVRLSLYTNGFHIYLNKGNGYRNATIASPKEIKGFDKVDMEHKIRCNPDVVAYSDKIL